MRTQDTDVLVIGSGFGAAAPALRLAGAGLRVTMVEKGPDVGPPAHGAREEFRQTQDPRYLTRYLKGLTGDRLNLTYAEALGGGSGFYEMMSLRAPSIAFDQRDEDGYRLWPESLDRQAFAPWYEIAERMLRVERISEAEVPRSGLVFSLLMKNLGYSCDRIPYAVRNCLGSGFCISGCIFGAKQSLHVNYLPQARQAGAEILCDLEALRLEPLTDPAVAPPTGPFAELPYRYAVICRPAGGGEPIRFRARLVVLGGGTLGTATLLLRSRPYLPGLSPHVGRHIGVNASVKVVGVLGDHLPDGDMFVGRSHPGMMSFEFLESRGLTVTAAKALPIQIVSAARFYLDGDPGQPAWWGAAHTKFMGSLRHRVLALASFGLTPPSSEITLAADGSPRVRLNPTPDLIRRLRDSRALLESIFRRNDCRVVRTEWLQRGGRPHRDLFLTTAHHTGSARMADRAPDGVVDRQGEVFGWPGLYVSDGAAIPSSLAVNTSLTILANAERVAAGILSRYGLGTRALAQRIGAA